MSARTDQFVVCSSHSYLSNANCRDIRRESSQILSAGRLRAGAIHYFCDAVPLTDGTLYLEQTQVVARPTRYEPEYRHAELRLLAEWELIAAQV